jgi:hypothetical protein
MSHLTIFRNKLGTTHKNCNYFKYLRLCTSIYVLYVIIFHETYTLNKFEILNELFSHKRASERLKNDNLVFLFTKNNNNGKVICVCKKSLVSLIHSNDILLWKLPVHTKQQFLCQDEFWSTDQKLIQAFTK